LTEDDGTTSAGTSADVESDRPLLMSVCYRLLGSVSEAEDAVQEAYARWYALPGAGRSEIASPTGWLITTASRISLDVLTSARVKRQTYVGDWLPEPVPPPAQWTTLTASGMNADPADRMTVDESVSMALLVVLESMTPAERVAFVLHDVFGYPFADIGDIVGRSPQACRQLASSARRRVRMSRTKPTDPAEHGRVVVAFKAAWETGDVASLVRMLDPESTAITDGGGLVSAATAPVRGAEAIANFLLDVRTRQPELDVTVTDVNGQDGLVASSQGRTLAVIAVAVKEQRIETIWVLRNPRKLRAWS
jgi:RNA polymerase sigma factor (sigma-70 family)